MKKISNKKIVLISAILLTLISIFTIIINGKTYTLEINLKNSVKDIEKYNINIIDNKKSIKLIDKKIKNNILELKFEGMNIGKNIIEVMDGEEIIGQQLLYVHNFNIITSNSYFGHSSGDIVFPISLFIFLSLICYLLINTYKKNIKENLYQYKNIVYLGIIMFLSTMIVNQLFEVFNYNNGLYGSIQSLMNSVNFFSLILFPIAFVTFILVTISNIKLLRKEGFTWRNMLGIILGLFLCFLTLFPEILNNYLQQATFIDVHNLNGFGYCIEMFVEALCYSIVAYLEAILLATIILEIKSVKKIPEFNKDYIIILGCKIRSDGGLTPLLKGRVDKALEFRNMQLESTSKDLIFVPSGGKGNDEVMSESSAIKNYLLECGINEKNILLEDKSKNTYQNIKFSNKLIKEQNKNAKIAFSTTNYHVLRAGLIATSQKIKMEGIGSKTKSYFYINAFIREYIGTLYSEYKKHLIVISLIILSTILMIGIIYISNIL